MYIEVIVAIQFKQIAGILFLFDRAIEDRASGVQISVVRKYVLVYHPCDTGGAAEETDSATNCLLAGNRADIQEKWMCITLTN